MLQFAATHPVWFDVLATTAITLVACSFGWIGWSLGKGVKNIWRKISKR